VHLVGFYCRNISDRDNGSGAIIHHGSIVTRTRLNITSYVHRLFCFLCVWISLNMCATCTCRI